MRLIWIHLGLLTLYCFVFVDSAPDIRKKTEKKCPALSLPEGRVRYRGGKKYAAFNCNPTLTLVGSQVSVCTEGEWSVPVPKCIGSTCDKPQVDTNVVVEEYALRGWLHFFCRSGYIREGPEDIYCIGTKWNSDPPTCKAGTSNGCDFEDGLCGWSHDITDDFNWVINQGETPTANTGPEADHTKNDSSGHYLFVESSAPQTTGHKARFLSPFYNVESLQNKCLEFYYHMYGEEGENNVGILEVFIRAQKIPTIALDTDHQIFYKTGNLGDNWIKADVIMPQVTEPVQFVFQATMKKSWLSDIAIDDIVIKDCRGSSDHDEGAIQKSVSITTQFSKSQYNMSVNSLKTSEPTTTIDSDSIKMSTASANDSDSIKMSTTSANDSDTIKMSTFKVQYSDSIKMSSAPAMHSDSNKFSTTTKSSTCDKPQVDTNVVVEDYSNGGWLHFFCRSGYIREGPEDIYCIGTKWNSDPPTCKARVQYMDRMCCKDQQSTKPVL